MTHPQAMLNYWDLIPAISQGRSHAKPDIQQKDPWNYTKTVLRRRLGILNVSANMVGAVIVASYFLFFEQTFAEENIKDYFLVIGVMFAVLVIIGTIF